MAIQQYTDIFYTENKDPFQAIDLYVPENRSTTGTKPELMVYIHGGCWRSEDKNGYVEFAKNFAALGEHPGKKQIAVAVVNYRLSNPGGTAKHPDHIVDCCNAVTFLFKNSEEYGFDPTRIHLIGHSAGGHLTGLMALDPPVEWWETKDPKSGLSIAESIRSVNGVAGMYDHHYIVGLDPDYLIFYTPNFGDDRNFWKGCCPSNAPFSEKHKKYVQGIYPPGFTPHGKPLLHVKYHLTISSMDELMMPEVSQHYAEHLKSLGILAGTNFDTDYGTHFGCLQNPDMQQDMYDRLSKA
ncbi:hypothetical protein BB560_007244 [Smittium megazygosporum]|uniref:BD-FAE-like domain-containing protein n=1 Tax=Smittium megazygosporum TaxID=133381 RepID=A0A2T9XXV8_9FUNG|nr:hypothetical protein BB560_007244 [Smittium megazygosporum]